MGKTIECILVYITIENNVIYVSVTDYWLVFFFNSLYTLPISFLFFEHKLKPNDFLHNDLSHRQSQKSSNKNYHFIKIL